MKLEVETVEEEGDRQGTDDRKTGRQEVFVVCLLFGLQLGGG